MSGARAAAPAAKDSDRGRVTLSKVSRYWAGKRPDGLDGAQDEQAGPSLFTGTEAGVKRTPVAAAVIVKKSDPRLARLANTDVGEAREEGRHRREVFKASVVKRETSDSDKETDTVIQPPAEEAPAAVGPSVHDEAGGASDDEAIEAQRRLRREKALQRQRTAEAEAATKQESSSEDESDSDSEYETGSSDEEEGRLAKPVFVAKSNRDTIAERERLEQEEESRVQADKARKELRKKETSSLVAEIVDQDNAAAKNQYDGPTNNPSDVDTSDGDEDEEFKAWQRRELVRIKLDRTQREARDAAAKERAMLAGMTEAQREEYAQRNATTNIKAPKGKMGFLQKYYHKGAFFQDEADDERGTMGSDSIFKRDFMGATGEDKFDRAALPAVMQVKNFGRAGRTKWTHLANEDTTQLATDMDPDALELAETFAGIHRKQAQKGGGMMQQFTKPHNTRT